MGYTKDLWFTTKEQPDGTWKRVPTARHGVGKRWLACWEDPDGFERSQAFRVKDAAKKYWQRMESDKERGEYYDHRAGKALLGEVAKRWFDSRAVDPASMIHYENVWRLHIEPEFGRRQVKSIKPSEVAAFQNQLRSRYRTSTVSTARGVFLGILDLAVADDLIKKNPVRSDVVPTVSRGSEEISVWSEDSVLTLIDAHPDSLRTLPIVSTTCGHRQGEAFALAEEDIDFDEKIIRVRRQIKKLGSHYVYAPPKYGKNRIVPMSDWTAANLRTHLATHPAKPCSLPWTTPDGESRTHNLVFQWFENNHLTARAYSETVWKPALVQAGIIPQPTKDGRGRRRYKTTRKEGMHQLRHFYASMVLADGVSIKELAAYLGHADPGFTLRIYTHLLPDSHDRARQAIDNRMFRPRPVADGT